LHYNTISSSFKGIILRNSCSGPQKTGLPKEAGHEWDGMAGYQKPLSDIRAKSMATVRYTKWAILV